MKDKKPWFSVIFFKDNKINNNDLGGYEKEEIREAITKYEECEEKNKEISRKLKSEWSRFKNKEGIR